MSKRYLDIDGVYDTVIDDYASTSAIVYHLNRITDLEAKLAESEEKYNNLWHWSFQELQSTQQQLSEKEKMLERIMSGEYIPANIAEKSLELSNQDKISFAVEQLEKVKELCKKKFDWWENSEWEGDIYDKRDVSNAYFDIEANIEEQIKAIKGDEVV